MVLTAADHLIHQFIQIGVGWALGDISAPDMRVVLHSLEDYDHAAI